MTRWLPTFWRGPGGEAGRRLLAGGREHFSRPSQSWGRPQGAQKRGQQDGVEQTGRLTEKRAPNQGASPVGVQEAFHRAGSLLQTQALYSNLEGGREGGRAEALRRHLCTAADSVAIGRNNTIL